MGIAIIGVGERDTDQFLSFKNDSINAPCLWCSSGRYHIYAASSLSPSVFILDAVFLSSELALPPLSQPLSLLRVRCTCFPRRLFVHFRAPLALRIKPLGSGSRTGNPGSPCAGAGAAPANSNASGDRDNKVVTTNTTTAAEVLRPPIKCSLSNHPPSQTILTIAGAPRCCR